jgi:hypothetical protein
MTFRVTQEVHEGPRIAKVSIDPHVWLSLVAGQRALHHYRSPSYRSQKKIQKRSALHRHEPMLEASHRIASRALVYGCLNHRLHQYSISTPCIPLDGTT